MAALPPPQPCSDKASAVGTSNKRIRISFSPRCAAAFGRQGTQARSQRKRMQEEDKRSPILAGNTTRHPSPITGSYQSSGSWIVQNTTDSRDLRESKTAKPPR